MNDNRKIIARKINDSRTRFIGFFVTLLLSYGKPENTVKFICVGTSHKGVTQIKLMSKITVTELIELN